VWQSHKLTPHLFCLLLQDEFSPRISVAQPFGAWPPSVLLSAFKSF